MSAEPLVRYGVLGPLRAEVDGVEVDLGPPRRRALLALLLTEAGRTVPAERVVELLWAGEPPEQALGTVHSYVSHLRRALEPHRPPRTPPRTILTRPPGYAVAVPPGRLDAADFERLAAEARASRERGELEAATARFGEALALWRGPAYEEFAGEAFAVGEARRLHELRLACQEDDADVQLALGRHGPLIAALEAAVREHPRRERLRGQLMLALYRAGRQADALRAYDEGRRHLIDALGLEPGPELQRLERAILDQDPALLDAPAAPRPAGAAAVGVPPPTGPAAPADGPAPGPLPAPARPAVYGRLVGRDAEVARLLAAWDAVAGGAARLVAVAGDPGIGKTRLANELAERVAAGGATVLWGRTTPEPLTAYQPFVEALSPLVGRVGLDPGGELAAGRPALARLFPEAAGTPAPGSPNPGFEVDRYLLFDAVAALADTATAAGPALLVLDDLQWTDPSTAALLVHVVRTLRARPLLVVETHRAAEVGPEHPLAAALLDLRRDHLLVEVDLAGLDGDAAGSLIRDLAGPASEAAVGDRTVAAVLRRTEGNPFFIEEIVSHALDTGDWGLEEGRIPKGILDIVGRRLDLLDADDRRTLTAAAVLGREFDLATLAAMTGQDEDALLDVVERGVRSHLVVEPATPTGRLAFSHALVRDVLLDGTMALRRQRLHRAAAEAIEASSPGAALDRAAEIAHHLLAAGPTVDRARLAHFLGQAALASLQVSSYEEAAERSRQALEVLGPDGEVPARADALLTLGAALLAGGDVAGSRAAYFEAAALAGSVGDGVRVAAAATGSGLGTGVGLGFEPGRIDVERVRLLEEALRLLAGRDPALEVWVLSYLVVALQEDPDPARRVAASVRAEELAARLGQDRLVSAAAIARRVVLADVDAPMEHRLTTGRAAIGHGDRAGEMPLRVVSRLGHLADLVEAGDLDGHDRVLADVDALVGNLRQRRWHWFVDVARAGRHLAAGRYRDADALVDAALEAVGGAQGVAPRQTHALQRLLLERDLGRAGESAARLEAWPGQPLGGTLRAAALGLALVAAGRLDEAEATYRPVAAEGFDAVPRNHLRLLTLAWLAETAAALGDVEGCRELDAVLARRDAVLVAVGGAGVAGSLARIRGLLAGGAGHADQAVAHHRAALDLHRRLGLEPWVVRSGAELAAALARTGDAVGAEAARNEARAGAAGLGMVPGW